jgi:hypothetical protein
VCLQFTRRPGALFAGAQILPKKSDGGFTSIGWVGSCGYNCPPRKIGGWKSWHMSPWSVVINPCSSWFRIDLFTHDVWIPNMRWMTISHTPCYLTMAHMPAVLFLWHCLWWMGYNSPKLWPVQWGKISHQGCSVNLSGAMLHESGLCAELSRERIEDRDLNSTIWRKISIHLA